MTRIGLYAILTVALNSFVFAQPMVQDFLPLAVGNSWCYNYSTYSSDLMTEYSSSDSGSVAYVIVSKTSQPDSTVWHFLECREGVTSEVWWASGNLRYNSTSFKDSTVFDLVEHHTGNHRILCPHGGLKPWKSVFYLTAQASDSSKFFRYLPSVDTDTIGVIAKWDHNAYQLKLTLRQGIGITRVEYSDPGITGGHSTTSHTLRSQILMAVEPEINGDGPRGFTLRPNYPNPFNPQTTITFSVGEREHVRLTIYDLLGRTIGTIFDDIAQAGTHSLVWDASSVSSGTYFCVARTAGGVRYTKLLFIR
jgi:hypothetical protein